jgi:hypothetical protein
LRPLSRVVARAFSRVVATATRTAHAPASEARRRRLRVAETLALPEHCALHVVEAGDRRLLLARSPAGMALLCDLGRE